MRLLAPPLALSLPAKLFLIAASSGKAEVAKSAGEDHALA
jgi:hypothetical protein